MERAIVLNGESVPYLLHPSRRAKYVRLTLYPNGVLRVSCPKRFSLRRIESFLREKEQWIVRNRTLHAGDTILPSYKGKQYTLYKEYARIFIRRKIEGFNKLYNFSYNRIAIKDLKSQWGSCSEKGNLNFTYKLIFLPEHLADYVIVHELCHIGEMNHSSSFWGLVRLAIPEYAQREKELSTYHPV